MTPDQTFNRWLRRAGILFAVVFIYTLFADALIPMTPHARVQRPVLAVAPRIAGEVTEVAVVNNQAVKAGDLLFRIDPTDYELQVEQAQLNLKQARRHHLQLQTQLSQANAGMHEAQAALTEQQRALERAQSLQRKHLISPQQLDRHLTRVSAAQAHLTASREQVHSLQLELGNDSEDLRILQAENRLKKAQLELSRTRVTAPENGVVSNLNLVPGAQARPNQPLLTLVISDKARISADFREKSLTRIADGNPALVVFDALPGQVFSATLQSRDQGVAQGQNAADGQLARTDNSDRWVRDAQRARVYLQLTGDNTADKQLFTGSRATVLLQSDAQGLWALLGALQMRLVSWLHFIY